MKKLITLLSGITLSIAVNAQQIPNAGFNSWSHIIKSSPESVDVVDKNGCQKLNIGDGENALTLINVNPNQVNGILYGNVDDQTAKGFGLPIDQFSNLTKIQIFFSIKNSTSNSFIYTGFFDADSNLIGGFPGGLLPTPVNNLNNLNGASPFDFASTPELVVPNNAVQMMVGYFLESPFNQTATVGDSVIIDNLFAVNQYFNRLDFIPNNEFNSWTDDKTDILNGWNDNNGENGKNRVIRDSISANNSVATLITKDNTMGKLSLGKIWRDNNSDKLHLEPVYKLDSVPSKLHIRYRYTTSGSDSALAMVILTKHRADTTAEVGGLYMKLLPSANFIEVEQMIGFAQGENSADSLIILLQSSANYNYQIEGSKLEVDTIWFEYPTITSLLNNDIQNTTFTIYPNPSTGNISISNAISISVSEITGELVNTQNNNRGQFDLSNLDKGIYLVESKDNHGKISRGKVVLY